MLTRRGLKPRPARHVIVKLNHRVISFLHELQSVTSQPLEYQNYCHNSSICNIHTNVAENNEQGVNESITISTLKFLMGIVYFRDSFTLTT